MKRDAHLRGGGWGVDFDPGDTASQRGTRIGVFLLIFEEQYGLEIIERPRVPGVP